MIRKNTSIYSFIADIMQYSLYCIFSKTFISAVGLSFTAHALILLTVGYCIKIQQQNPRTVYILRSNTYGTDHNTAYSVDARFLSHRATFAEIRRASNFRQPS